MRLLSTLLQILAWILFGFVLWVFYPILIKILTLGQQLHHLWN